MTIRQHIKILSVGLLLMFLCSGALFSASAVAAEGTSPIKQMAAILLQLHHYPSQEDKVILQSIIDNKSTREFERTIATAILNLNHKATASDITALKAVIMSKDSTDNEKDLATSVINLNHEPTPKDKKRLELMK